MKGKRGTSPFFVITAVIFEENEEAEECDRIIEETKRRLFKNTTTEFHFSNCSDEFRQSFFEAIASSQFFYLSFVLNKQKSGVLGSKTNHRSINTQPIYFLRMQSLI